MANVKVGDTSDNFKHQVVVPVKWQIMKRTEDKPRIMRNPPRTLKNSISADIQYYSPLKFTTL